MERIANALKITYYSLAIVSMSLTLLGLLGLKLNFKWLAWLQNTISWPIWGLLLYSLILITIIPALIQLYRTIKERQDFAVHRATYGKGSVTKDRTK